jgi:flavin reductase (DIM6/NTAB) family NADH-FMN oxidoreductase RutF
MHDSLPAEKAYRILEAGPVILVSTGTDGRTNLMTAGFHMMMQHAPPLVGVIIGLGLQLSGAVRYRGMCSGCTASRDGKDRCGHR